MHLCSYFGTDLLLAVCLSAPPSSAMPGFHVSVTYLPYFFAPAELGTDFQHSIFAEAMRRGLTMPPTILGSLMLVSTPSQRLQDYQVFVRAQSYLLPWDGPGRESLGSISQTNRLFPIPMPEVGAPWWDERDAAILTLELARYYGFPCKAHYYFANYDGGVDCYVQEGQDFVEGTEYLHYAVRDIREPTDFFKAQDYVYKGKVVYPEWKRNYHA